MPHVRLIFFLFFWSITGMTPGTRTCQLNVNPVIIFKYGTEESEHLEPKQGNCSKITGKQTWSMLVI